MTLHSGGYDWQFVPVAGAHFADSGSGTCRPSVDTTAPAAPTGLTATASGAGVTLAWTKSTDDTGVVRYDVYRDGALLATTSGTSFLDSSVTPGVAYSYAVRALDAAGNVSTPSNTATATAVSGPAPTSVGSDWASGPSGALTVPASAGAAADSTKRLMLSVTDSATAVAVPVPSPGDWGTPVQIRVSDEITYVWVREVRAGDGGATLSWTGGSGTLKGTVGVIHGTSGLDQAIAGAAHNTLDSAARSSPTQTPNGPNRLGIGVHTSDASPNPGGSAWKISGSVPAGWAGVHESVTSVTGAGGSRFILPFVQAVTLASAVPASAGAAPTGGSGTKESSQVIALFAPVARGGA